MAPPVLYCYQKGEIKMVDEKIMKELMRMLHERRDWYYKQAANSKVLDFKQRWSDIATVYDSCCWMLNYALHGDTDALAQYDYFEKGD